MVNNKVFRTTNGWEVHIFPIQIQLGDLAVIKCIQLSSIGMYDKTYTLEGNDYTQWGNDDDYIKNYICNKEVYLGQPVTEPAASSQ